MKTDDVLLLIPLNVKDQIDLNVLYLNVTSKILDILCTGSLKQHYTENKNSPFVSDGHAPVFSHSEDRLSSFLAHFVYGIHSKCGLNCLMWLSVLSVRYYAVLTSVDEVLP